VCVRPGLVVTQCWWSRTGIRDAALCRLPRTRRQLSTCDGKLGYRAHIPMCTRATRKNAGNLLHHHCTTSCVRHTLGALSTMCSTLVSVAPHTSYRTPFHRGQLSRAALNPRLDDPVGSLYHCFRWIREIAGPNATATGNGGAKMWVVAAPPKSNCNLHDLLMISLSEAGVCGLRTS
jgi:hypothetical protein